MKRGKAAGIDAGAPAGFQARVGKHLFDKIRREASKNFFRLLTLVFGRPYYYCGFWGSHQTLPASDRLARHDLLV